MQGEGTHTPPERPCFVYAGRLEASKGVEDLVPAFRDRPGYDLLIAGDGRLSARLRDLCRDAPNIRLLGSVPHAEIGDLYGRATAVVSPTWGPEAFPLVTIEAMSCGTPVIGRRAGGSAEAIELTGGGLAYDAPRELAPLVDRVAGDRELRARLSAAALQGYRRHFSEDRWMARYFDVIREIAADKGLPCNE
jgi:glycosyltransferase involved in cell wall biosynthesis